MRCVCMLSKVNLNWNRTLKNNALLQLESINLHKWFSFAIVFVSVASSLDFIFFELPLSRSLSITHVFSLLRSYSRFLSSPLSFTSSLFFALILAFDLLRCIFHARYTYLALSLLLPSSSASSPSSPSFSQSILKAFRSEQTKGQVECRGIDNWK